MAKYIFTKIEDKPTLTSEYVGKINTSTEHSKEHTFNLGKEAEDKLMDIVMKYGITKNDFTEEDKKNHYFFYKILTNNKRYGNDLVYYYYSKELEYLDKYNLPLNKEMYQNGILLYGVNDMMSINNAYRLTEKESVESNERGYLKETIEDFKKFFLEKRRGHDFRKDLDEILNAKDNAVEYETTSENKYYSKKYHHPIEKQVNVTVKSPRMEFILNKTNLTPETKRKFMEYTDLKDFVERADISKFDKNEFKEFFDAVDRIDNKYMLHYELMDEVEALKEKIGL